MLLPTRELAKLADILPEVDVSELSDGAANAKFKLRILVIDESAICCRSLSKMLTAEGLEVRDAASVRAALDIACEWLPDIIFCELELIDEPCNAWPRLKQADPALILLSCSALERRQAIIRSRLAGFAAHLIKPFGFEQLMHTIKVAWSDSQRPEEPMSPSTIASSV